MSEDWENLRVPTYASIRDAVARGERPPNRLSFPSGDVYVVVRKRWDRAFRELCPHPEKSRTTRPNLIGEPKPECGRCGSSPSCSDPGYRS